MGSRIKSLSILAIGLVAVVVLVATSAAISEIAVSEDPSVISVSLMGSENLIQEDAKSERAIWYEAENGWLEKTLMIGQEVDRGYIYTPEQMTFYGSGMNYFVSIPEDGDYCIEGIVRKPNCGSDSFYVTLYRHNEDGQYVPYDFGTEQGWGSMSKAHWRMEWCHIPNNEWSSCYVNHVNVYVTPNQIGVPLVYHLEKGEYRVKVDMREDGTQLDKFRFVEAGPQPPPTPTPPVIPTIIPIVIDKTEK